MFAMDPVQAKLETYWAVLLAAWTSPDRLGVMWMYGMVLGHYEVVLGSSPIYVLTGWTGVLALMGAGRHFSDVNNTFTGYLGAASVPGVYHSPGRPCGSCLLYTDGRNPAAPPVCRHCDRQCSADICLLRG